MPDHLIRPVLRSSGPVSVSTPTQPNALKVDDFSIELYSVAAGNALGSTLVIPPGVAYFLANGFALGEHRTVGVTNGTAISLRKVGPQWVIDPFELTYDDGQGKNWVLAVGSSTWK